MHTFLVRAIDINQNVDPEPASYTWRSVAPPLEPIIGTVPPEPSQGNAHTFEFSAQNEPNATFECRITPNPFHNNLFEACTSPHTYTNLPDGEYLFQVRAVNEYGIPGEIPAEHSFEVANTPDTSILAGPSGTTTDRIVAFAVLASEQGSIFECFLNAVELPCEFSPVMIPDNSENVPPDLDCDPEYSQPNADGTACELLLGTYTFVVQAVDVDGNIDPTPATRTFTVIEPTYPETMVLGGPPATTTATDASFELSSSEPGSTFQCSLDNVALSPCTSPLTLTGLGLGEHTLRVAAVDPGGEVDPTPAVVTWTIVEPDTVAPDTTISDAPADPTNLTDAVVEFDAEPGAVYACKLDAGDYVHCSSPVGYFGLADGSHTISVRATDASGNVEVDPAVHTWTVDTASPNTQITSRPSNPSVGSFLSFGLAATDNHSDAGDIDFKCRLDDAPWVDCADPKSYADRRRRPAHLLRAGDRRGRQRRTGRRSPTAGRSTPPRRRRRSTPGRRA